MNLKHDVYTIPMLCILRIVIILFLKLKDIKNWLFLGDNRGYVYICII